MASFVARQALSSLRRTGTTYARFPQRAMHMTPVVQKKKARVEIDSLFDEAEDFDELIKENATVAEAAPSAPVASTSALDPSASAATPVKATISHTESKRHKLSPEKRLQRFNDILAFVEPRIGRHPEVKLPQVRNSAWLHLIGLATNEEQLRQVVERFPKWTGGGRVLDAHISEVFVRRCEELSCPLLALDVFGNYPKYQLSLTLPGARQLLHSLHTAYPIDKTTLAAALFSVYDLPPLSSDLVCCALFVSALYKNNSPAARVVADALVPHLETIMTSTPPRRVSEVPMEKARQKPDVWAKWALRKIDKALFVRDGKRAEWLSRWRKESGHIPELSAF